MTSLTQSRFFTKTCTVTHPPVVGESGNTTTLTDNACTAVYPMDSRRWGFDVSTSFEGYEIQLEAITAPVVNDTVTVDGVAYTILRVNRWPKLALSTYDIYDLLLEERKDD